MAIHSNEESVSQNVLPCEVNDLEELVFGLRTWSQVLKSSEGDLVVFDEFCVNVGAFYRAVLSKENRESRARRLHLLGSGIQALILRQEDDDLVAWAATFDRWVLLLESLGDEEEEPLSALQWVLSHLKNFYATEIETGKLGVELGGVPSDLSLPNGKPVLEALVNLLNNALSHAAVTGVDLIVDPKLDDPQFPRLEMEVLQVGADLPDDFDFDEASNCKASRGVTGNGLKDAVLAAKECGGSLELVSPQGAWFRLTVPVSVKNGFHDAC